MLPPAWTLAAALLAGPTPSAVEAQENLRRGQALLAEESFEDAATAFRAAIRLDPLLVMAHYGLGQARMAQKDFTSAVEAFSGARDAFLQHASESMSLGLAHEDLRQDRIRELQDKIRQNRQLVFPAGSRLERIRERRVQQWELEVEALQRSLRDLRRETPGPPPGVLIALGSARFRSGDLAGAEREYRAALEVRPGLGEAENNLAVVLLLTGRPAEASEHLKLAERDGFKVHPDLRRDVEKALASVSAK